MALLKNGATKEVSFKFPKMFQTNNLPDQLPVGIFIK